MARYRKYQNGIFGSRYKGFYIIKSEEDNKKKFKIVDENAEIVTNEEFKDYDEAQWWIDKKTATSKEIEVIEMLYKKEIYQLTELMMQYIEKSDKEELSLEEQKVYDMVTKIRSRKANDRPY